MNSTPEEPTINLSAHDAWQTAMSHHTQEYAAALEYIARAVTEAADAGEFSIVKPKFEMPLPTNLIVRDKLWSDLQQMGFNVGLSDNIRQDSIRISWSKARTPNELPTP